MKLTFGAAGRVRFQRPDDDDADGPLLKERPLARRSPNRIWDAAQSVIVALVHRKLA